MASIQYECGACTIKGNGRHIIDILVSLGEFQSWSVVFDTEYIANQKMVQVNAFELSLNLQYQPTLYISWFSCNLQKYIEDFREITPNRANAWCSAL